MSEANQALNVMTLADELEGLLHKHLIQTAAGPELQLEPGLLQRLLAAIDKGVDYCRREGYVRTAILCDPRIRRQLRRLIEKAHPHVAVISYAEVAPGFTINNLFTLAI